MRKNQPIDYEAIRQRINRRCEQLSIVAVDGISDARLADIRKDAHGISTLELTRLGHALHISISSLVFGKDGKL